LNGDVSVDTLGESDKFQFMISYALSPSISYASTSLTLPPLPPPSTPCKKSTIFAFYKPILKWAKKHSYQLELSNETSLNQEEQKKYNHSISMFHDVDFPPVNRKGLKLSFLVAEEFVDP